jgi:cytochrome c oxidase assembly protein subunit 15/protoheme IX farnesyltransferase
VASTAERAGAVQPVAGRNNRFERFAWGVLAYIILVVLWGTYVRATGSGAGCGSHWPLCNGDIIPRAPAVETIIEFTHRVTSGIALILVAWLSIWSFRSFPRGHRVRLFAVLSTVFLLVEALLGAGLVLFEYVAQNASAGRAVYLSAHLVNTQVLLGLLTVTAWLAGRPVGSAGLRETPKTLLAALPVALVVSITGAIAALGDTLYPASSGTVGDLLSSATPALLRLRLLHPVSAVLGGAYLALLAWRVVRSRSSRTVRTAAWAVGSLVFVQLVAGLVNIALLAPVWMQIVHLLLADLLWIALVLLVAEAGEQRRATAAIA